MATNPQTRSGVTSPGAYSSPTPGAGSADSDGVPDDPGAAGPCTGLGVGGSKTIQAAWVRFPELTVEKSAQTYSRLDEFTYRCASGTFEAELIVDEDGVVAQYAAWERTGVASGPDDTEPLDSR